MEVVEEATVAAAASGGGGGGPTPSTGPLRRARRLRIHQQPGRGGMGGARRPGCVAVVARVAGGFGRLGRRINRTATAAMEGLLGGGGGGEEEAMAAAAAAVAAVGRHVPVHRLAAAAARIASKSRRAYSSTRPSAASTRASSSRS